MFICFCVFAIFVTFLFCCSLFDCVLQCKITTLFACFT
nr:MAG TPA: hypothetical protein [Caudoviricetes sp.]